MQAEAGNATFKIPAKLYRIGEVVSSTPFSRQTIHNYTIMGLISETKWTEGGHRLYDESVFERLAEIRKLKREKTLVEIRQILDSKRTKARGLSTEQRGGSKFKNREQGQQSVENN
jgi:DNA-binding transcriptional MerR regulator